MKRLLLVVLLLAVVVGSVGATQLTFSKARDSANTTINSSVTTGVEQVWAGYGAGLNGYMTGSQAYVRGFTLASPLQTQYAAATVFVNGDDTYARLYGPTRSLESTLTIHNNECVGRAEVVVSGGIAYGYCNGAYGGNVTVTTNPSYVSFGTQNPGGWSTINTDDYTYGTDEVREVIGMPDGEVYALQKDFITGASSGLVWIANESVANSTYMAVTFSRGNATSGMTGGTPLTNKSICLKHVTSDTCYQYRYTGTANYGTVNFDLPVFMATAAPLGVYSVELEDSEAVSDQIVYMGTGATITFDEDGYSQGDTATITHDIEDDYWLPGDYDYSVKVYDGTTWETKEITTISTQTGTTTYDFSSDDDAGVYYAVLIATDKISGDENWMDLDWADLDAYVTFYGYVMNETGSVLAGANISAIQGDITDTEVTITDGNYTATGFYAGAVTWLNVTKPGYSDYNVSLIPLVAKRIPLNFTLNSTSPTFTGLAIGGVARDGVFNDTTRVITGGYGRPLSGATVYVWNFSSNYGYTKTTNIAGWYLCDEGESCVLEVEDVFDIQGRKGGYLNSTNYTVVTA